MEFLRWGKWWRSAVQLTNGSQTRTAWKDRLGTEEQNSGAETSSACRGGLQEKPLRVARASAPPPPNAVIACFRAALRLHNFDARSQAFLQIPLSSSRHPVPDLHRVLGPSPSGKRWLLAFSPRSFCFGIRRSNEAEGRGFPETREAAVAQRGVVDIVRHSCLALHRDSEQGQSNRIQAFHVQGKILAASLPFFLPKLNWVGWFRPFGCWILLFFHCAVEYKLLGLEMKTADSAILSISLFHWQCCEDYRSLSCAFMLMPAFRLNLHCTCFGERAKENVCRSCHRVPTLWFCYGCVWKLLYIFHMLVGNLRSSQPWNWEMLKGLLEICDQVLGIYNKQVLCNCCWEKVSLVSL